jgi:hypothetical protein
MKTPMQVLTDAETYVKSFGYEDDYGWFCQYYTRFREQYGVRESVEYTLALMYGDDVVNQILGG